MEINDYNSIEKAEIEINKINVIGGVNGSGKSTASKILYSFLKGNSIKRREYAIKYIADNVNFIIEDLKNECNTYNFPDPLSFEDEESVFYDKYNSILNITQKHDELVKIKLKELSEKLSNEINLFIKKLNDNNIDISELELSEDIKSNILDLKIFLYNNKLNQFSDDFDKINELFNEYSDLDMISDTNFWCSLNNKLMNNLFIEDTPYLSMQSQHYIEGKEFINNVVNNVDFNIKSLNLKYGAYEYFFKKGFIDNVYYVDNVSIFDLVTSEDIGELFHMNEIIADLFETNDAKDLDEEVTVILNKIEKIIKGKYNKKMPVFQTNKLKKSSLITDNYLDKLNDDSFLKKIKEYRMERKIDTYNFNTPSGIKQIGVIQLLLLNNKLKKGGYLIIDEPEVNLHPEWQIKFAEILVLIAKELNITLYLNSHSPMFIEAMSLYAQYYDLIEGINVYLTQEVVDDKYVFKKIDSKNMGEVYENLTKPYDELDKLKAKILFKE